MVKEEGRGGFKLRLLLAFVAVYFIWGTTYLAIRFGLEDIGPFVMSTLRYGTAAILLAAWCIANKYRWPKTQLKQITGSGVLMLVGGSGLVVYAEQYITSGLAAVVIATEPLWFVLLDKKRWKQYFAHPKIIWGLVLGFMGIILFAIFSPTQASGSVEKSQLWSVAIVVCGSVFWVIGALSVGKQEQTTSSALTASTIQLTASSIVCAVVAAIGGEWTAFHPADISALAWGGLAYLALMGTLVAYLAFLWLVKVRPPAVVSTHTLVNPVIAVVMGWLFLQEAIDGKQVVALAIALAGVFLTWSSKQQQAVEI